MGKVIYTVPAKEPTTVSACKEVLRISKDDNSDDALIERYIKSARRLVEQFLNRALITQTWDFFPQEFPIKEEALEIPLPPLQSVSFVNYRNTGDSDYNTWGVSNYIVDIKNEPGHIIPAYGVSFPSASYPINPIQIRFVVGYGNNPENVPEDIVSGIEFQVMSMFENGLGKGLIKDVRDSLMHRRIIPKMSRK